MFETLNLIRRSYDFKFDDMNKYSIISGWVNDPVRGWHNDSLDARAVDNVLPNGSNTFMLSLPFNLSRIRSISGIFTTYYNTPAGGLGVNVLWCTLRNVITNELFRNYGIGHRDAWTDHTNGMLEVQGFDTIRIHVDRIDQQMSIDIPVGYEVIEIHLDNAWYVTSSKDYPASLRGVKDLTIHLK